MNTFRTLHRSILLLFAVVVIAIVTLVHFSVNKIVAEQSRAQQQSLSPAISLIVNQLLKPLHVSEALGRSTELVALMDSEELDVPEIQSALARLEDEFGMKFFIASEKARMQFNSDGTLNIKNYRPTESRISESGKTPISISILRFTTKIMNSLAFLVSPKA